MNGWGLPSPRRKRAGVVRRLKRKLRRKRRPRPQRVPSSSSVEVQVMRLQNQARRAHGLRPLGWDDDLAAAARYHARDMQRRGYLGHDSRDGTRWFKRVARFYRDYDSIGENVAGGFDDAERVFDAWMRSPEHRANILSRKYSECGVGVAGSHWVVDFGRE